MRKVFVYRNGKAVPKAEARRAELHIIPDIEPYRPVAGPEAEAFIRKDKKNAKLIGGRRQHREYLKRNGLIEVGNEWDYMTRYGGKTEDNPTRDYHQYQGKTHWAEPDIRRLMK